MKNTVKVETIGGGLVVQYTQVTGIQESIVPSHIALCFEDPTRTMLIPVQDYVIRIIQETESE